MTGFPTGSRVTTTGRNTGGNFTPNDPRRGRDGVAMPEVPRLGPSAGERVAAAGLGALNAAGSLGNVLAAQQRGQAADDAEAEVPSLVQQAMDGAFDPEDDETTPEAAAEAAVSQYLNGADQTISDAYAKRYRKVAIPRIAAAIRDRQQALIKNARTEAINGLKSDSVTGTPDEMREALAASEQYMPDATPRQREAIIYGAALTDAASAGDMERFSQIAGMMGGTDGDHAELVRDERRRAIRNSDAAERASEQDAYEQVETVVTESAANYNYDGAREAVEKSGLSLGRKNQLHNQINAAEQRRREQSMMRANEAMQEHLYRYVENGGLGGPDDVFRVAGEVYEGIDGVDSDRVASNAIVSFMGLAEANGDVDTSELLLKSVPERYTEIRTKAVESFNRTIANANNAATSNYLLGHQEAIFNREADALASGRRSASGIVNQVQVPMPDGSMRTVTVPENVIIQEAQRRYFEREGINLADPNEEFNARVAFAIGSGYQNDPVLTEHVASISRGDMREAASGEQVQAFQRFIGFYNQDKATAAEYGGKPGTILGDALSMVDSGLNPADALNNARRLASEGRKLQSPAGFRDDARKALGGNFAGSAHNVDIMASLIAIEASNPNIDLDQATRSAQRKFEDFFIEIDGRAYSRAGNPSAQWVKANEFRLKTMAREAAPQYERDEIAVAVTPDGGVYFTAGPYRISEAPTFTADEIREVQQSDLADEITEMNSRAGEIPWWRVLIDANNQNYGINTRLTRLGQIELPAPERVKLSDGAKRLYDGVVADRPGPSAADMATARTFQ